MPSRIKSIGLALPPNSIAQQESFMLAKNYSCQNSKQERVLESLYNRTTIRSRSSVLISSHETGPMTDFYRADKNSTDDAPTTATRMRKYNESAPTLAVAACGEALSKANIAGHEITHLISVSCTGFSSPGFDIVLTERLPLPATIFRTNVGYMGCHGAFNALRVADAFVTANPSAVVLLCAVEICTLHFQYGWSADSLVANSLFADGAGAIVLRNDDAGLLYSASCSTIVPDTKTAMTWTIGDHGFVMTLASEVPAIIESKIKPFIEDWLAQFSLKISDIGGWAVHPGGPKILDAVESGLELHHSSFLQSRDVLSKHGNMSSPTVLFILQQLFAQNIPRPYVMLGFGPGLTIEAALIR